MVSYDLEKEMRLFRTCDRTFNASQHLKLEIKTTYSVPAQNIVKNQ
ncbi:predicted protein [Botrytis cinerea T4]|uniref:Uncharacterized protein n=1 Tax=Botryotinia fuckeliana (strain T4) TaxID=999810 RepID=G2YXW5_BOTF4|nr:predicted protein [Botrytis cinerea T4]